MGNQIKVPLWTPTPEDTARRQELWRQTEEILAREAVPIVADLARHGIKTHSYWSLSKEQTVKAIPLLLKHLQLDYSHHTKFGLALALDIPEAEVGWDILLDQFKKADDQTERATKQALAHALITSGDHSKLPIYLGIVHDPIYGASRWVFVHYLRRLWKRPNVWAVLEELAREPDPWDLTYQPWFHKTQAKRAEWLAAQEKKAREKHPKSR